LSSADVTRIVASNRMAVVVGVEIDAIGNFYQTATQDQITAEINRLYGEGVRYAFPIHLLDNAFGGAAIYDAAFDYSTHRESKHWYSTTCAPTSDQIPYNLKSDIAGQGGTLTAVEALKLTDLLQPGFAITVTAAEAVAAAAGPYAQVGVAALWGAAVSQAVTGLQQPPDPGSCTGSGHINTLGLTSAGHFAINLMMQKGMLVDIDHMSEASQNNTISDDTMFGSGAYPLISGHSAIREGGGSERNPSAATYASIGKSHGMAGIGTANVGAGHFAKLSLDTISAMGGRGGLAFGTDTDGLQPGMPANVPGLPVGGRPAALFSHELATGCITNCQHDQQHLFYRDSLGAIVHTFYDNGADLLVNVFGNVPNRSAYRKTETWAGTASALTNAPVAVGDPAVMFTDSMQQHVFYRDDSGNINHVFFDPNNGIKAEVWASGAGSPTMGPAAAGDPAALWDPGSEQQHIFYRDAAGKIQHVYYQPGSGLKWDAASNWGTNAVGTPATMYSNENGFACINNCAHKQQHLFFRDTSNRIIHFLYDEDVGAMKGPEIWGGVGGKSPSPAAGNPATLFTPNNQQHMFYRDVNGRIQHVYWDNPSDSLNNDPSWGNNGPLAAGDVTTLFTHETGTLCTINCAPDVQHIFYRTTTNTLFHEAWNESNSSWSANETLISSGVTGDEAAIMSQDMQIHVFFPDTNWNVEHLYGEGGASTTVELWSGSTGDDAGLAPIAYGSSFTRSSQTSGSDTKIWDYNYQGVVHYGMLPDYLQAMQGAPHGADLVNNNLMWGAQQFIDMWKAAEGQSVTVFSATVSSLGTLGLLTSGTGAVAVAVGTNGAIYTRSASGGSWAAPVAVSTTGFAPVNAGLAAGAQSATQNDAFVVGNDGAVYVMTSANGGPWTAPSALTPAAFASPGSRLVTATWGGQLGVFVVDATGTLDVIWWNPVLGWLGPVAITPAGYAPPGAALAWGTRATGEQDIFVVGSDGALRYMAFNLGLWTGPFVLTVPAFAPAGAPVAAAMDVHGFLNAFVVGNDGALYTKWDATPLWSGPTAITATGFAQPGSGVSAINFANTSLYAFVVDGTGTIDVLSNGGLSWVGPTAISGSGEAQPGASTWPAIQGNQLDLLAITNSGIAESTQTGTGWSAFVAIP
jgi:hypothetical protein